MNRSRPLLRRVGLLGAVLLLAAGATGCNASRPGAQPPAATVNGTDITRSQVEELAKVQVAFANAAAPLAAKAAEAQPADQQLASDAQSAEANRTAINAGYKSTGSDSIGTEGASQVLNTLIQVEISRAALDAVGGKVDPATAKQIRSSLESQLKGQGFTDAQIKKYEPLIDAEVENRAIQAALDKHYRTPEAVAAREVALRKTYDQEVEAQTQMCLNLLVTADEATTQAAVDRITAGEDFIAVANEVSTDKTSLTEGAERCVPRNAVAGVFGDGANTAQVGDVLGPAGADGSFIAAKVASIKVPTFEESRAQLEQAVTDPVTARVEQAITRQLKRAEITVDPRFGTWNPKTGLVEPPFDPLATTTTTTLAAVAPAPAQAGG